MTYKADRVKETVPTIKQRVDCREVFRRFWPDRFREHGNCRCPNPGHEDQHPSCQVTFERAYCHAEGQSWDVIRLYMLGTGLGFNDAVTALAQEVEIEDGGKALAPTPLPPPAQPTTTMPPNGNDTPPNQPKRQPPPGKKVVPEETLDGFKALPEELQGYLTSRRGWTTDVIKSYQIGYEPKTERITIPIRDEEGDLVNVRRYLPGAAENKIMSWRAGFGESRLFPISMLAKTGYGAPIILCEGEPDALCGISHGLNCITQTAGAESWHDPFNAHFKRRHVIIAYDNDEAGQKGIEKVVRHLPVFAAKVESIKWPEFMGEKEDLTDWFMKHHRSAEDFLALPRVKHEKAASDGELGVTSELVNPATGRLLKHRGAATVLKKYLPDFAFDSVTAKWFRYHNCCWRPITNHQALKAIDLMIGELASTHDYNTQYVRGVAQQLSYYLSWDDRESPKNAIPFRNGVLFLDSRTFAEHKPEYHFTYQLPFHYDSKATCELVQYWLIETVKDDSQVELLRAYLNAIITGRFDLHRFLELIGPGGTGKGTFLRLAEAVVGHENVHATELKHLENNRFETAGLYGKRLAVITDAEKYGGDVSVLKAITGGDSIRYEEKHKQGGSSFRFHGMVLIAANQDIKTADYTSGLQRRRITIRFENQVPPEKRRNLEDEFQPYLPGVVNWVLGMPKTRVEELLVSTEKHVKTLAGTSLKTLCNINPIAAWAHTNLVYGIGYESPVGIIKFKDNSREIANFDDHLFPNFCQWCRETNHREMSLNNFVSLLKDLLINQLKLPGVKHRAKRTGKVIEGIGFRNISTHNELSPLEASFEGEKDVTTVTAGCGAVTTQTRMVTKFRHIPMYNSDNNDSNDIEGMNECSSENIGKNLQYPQKVETLVTEPLQVVTASSQVVTDDPASGTTPKPVWVEYL